jgi:hypothetical protein
MMRIQYEKLVVRIHKLIDDELEMDTDEGREAFRSMTQALFDVYARNRKERLDHVQATNQRGTGAPVRDLARRGPSVVGMVLSREAT